MRGFGSIQGHPAWGRDGVQDMGRVSEQLVMWGLAGATLEGNRGGR